MSAVNNGGPAFPAPYLGYRDAGDPAAYPGKALRDYFAANAMNAIVAGAIGNGGATHRDDAPKIADAAFLVADAMLKAREVQP